MDKLADFPKEAFALQPIRADEKNDRFVYYTATTFPNGPYDGCLLYMRRAALGGGIVDSSPYTIEVLNEKGDPIKEYNVSRTAFEYLRRTLKFRVDRD